MARVRGTPRPVLGGAPALSGTATLGQVLTCSVPYMTGDPPITTTYQWIRDASTVIAGAVNPTYTIVAADQTHKVKCRVTVSNAYDTVVVETAQTGTIP